MSNETFPTRLRRLRERRHISRRVLSELCGLSQNMVAVYERGEVEPTASALKALATCLEVSADYLLGISENIQSAQYIVHGPN